MGSQRSDFLKKYSQGAVALQNSPKKISELLESLSTKNKELLDQNLTVSAASSVVSYQKLSSRLRETERKLENLGNLDHSGLGRQVVKLETENLGLRTRLEKLSLYTSEDVESLLSRGLEDFNRKLGVYSSQTNVALRV